LEVLAKHCGGENENRHEVADFFHRGRSARKGFSLAYFGSALRLYLLGALLEDSIDFLEITFNLKD
tara:strand:- start:47760 stop:47957 length:198 start_codon:yes stop_codon:yes gene_type:complete